MEMSPETERQLAQFEQTRQQYQTIATQLIQFKQMIREVERALEETGKVDSNAKIYREIGALMIEVSDREKLKEELMDKKETMEIRTKSLQSQEIELKKHLGEMKADIENAFSKES